MTKTIENPLPVGKFCPLEADFFAFFSPYLFDFSTLQTVTKKVRVTGLEPWMWRIPRKKFSLIYYVHQVYNIYNIGRFRRQAIYDLERRISVIAISEKSIAEQLKTGGYKLLGQVQVSEEEYEFLVLYTRRAVKSIYMSTIPRTDLTLSLAMVQIAMRCYQEGKYWKCFQDELGIELPSSKLNYLGQIFAKTIRIHGLLELKRDENSSQMYVENIKAHAFVTNYYMQGFFDFSYAFYENNLFRELSDDLGEDITALSEFMATTLSSNKDAVSADGSGKKAAKSYKLLKSTRAIFAQSSLQTVYALFYPILTLIDKYYYDDEVPAIPQNRYETLFVEWCRNRQISEHSKRSSGTVRHLFNHKPYIKINVDKELGTLVVPAQKFRNEDCDGEAKVLVTINGYTETRPLELYRSFGIFISEELIIPILDIFEDIEVCIGALAERRYCFKKSNYRVFNTSWESIQKFTRGHNYLLVKKGVDVNWNEGTNLLDQTDAYHSWLYFSANITDETICYVGKKPISIIGEFSSDPVYDTPIENFKVFTADNNELIAVRGHPGVSFVVAKNKFNGTILLVNSKKYFVKDIHEKTVYEWPEDKNKVAITIALENYLPNSDGRFIVYLDVPGEPNKRICDYILLRSFNCRLDKPKYIYAELASLSIKKDGHQVNFNHPDWNLDYETAGNVLASYPLTNDTKSLGFSLLLNDETYTVQIPVYFFMYGFSPSTLTIQRPDYIWYSDLGETLYVKLPGAKNMFAYWQREKDKCCHAEEMQGDLFRIDISELLRKVKKEYKYRWQYINLEYTDEKTRQIALPPILRNIVVDPYFKLNAEGPEVFMDLYYQGKAELYLDVFDHHTKEKIISNRVMDFGRNIFPELTPDGFYDLIPYMEEPDEFGFDTERTALKPLRGVGCIDMNNLVNCRLQLKEILMDEEPLSLDYLYFVHTYEKLAEDEYSGGFFRVQMVDGKPNWTTKKVFGFAQIHIYQKDEEIKFSLLMFSKDEEEWLPPYYDNQRHYILGCDNHLISTLKDYNRFIPMEEDYTEYIVDTERLRRIK